MLMEKGYFRANFNGIWPERLDLPIVDTERVIRLNTKNKMDSKSDSG